MKKLLSYLLVAMLVPTLFLAGCKDKDDPAPVEKGTIETLKAYLVNQNMDLPALLDGWVVAPAPKADGGIVDVDNDCTIPDYHVFDIRKAEDFANGHIKGAINVALTDIVTKAAEYADKTILVVCYSGQTAGRGAMALRLAGYQAKVMKFGMSYWNEVFDKWSGNVGNVGVDNPNWVNTDAPDLQTNELPTWESTITDPAELLASRINAMLGASGWGTKSTEILANPTAFTTYNFWTLDTEYKALGHFAGAYHYKPISLDVINALPVQDDFYIYCFTGQTSSFIVAWLQVLGYDNAKSALYGANAIIHDGLDAYNPKVTWHHSYDYTYVVEN